MKKIIVISGAGISSESGIPTFRDANGLWCNHRVEDVADFYTWEMNYDLVHKFYNERRASLANCQPNTGHEWFADISKRYYCVHMTQNVDNLLEKADYSFDHDHTKETSKLIHLHGYLEDVKCHYCDHVWNVGSVAIDPHTIKCPKCGFSKIKPSVVFFGEHAPNYHFISQYLTTLTSDDILIVAGTNGNVLPINSLVWNCPAYKILNNLEPNTWIDDSYFDRSLFMKLSETVPIMDEIVRQKFGY